VFERPANTYVAGFIGAPTMNFLPAQLTSGGTAARLPTGLLLPFADGRREGADGRTLTVGIRPEHLAPGPGLDMAIELIEPLGSETLVHGRVGDLPLVVKLAGRASGERMQVAPQIEHLHVFDQTTGARIDPIGAEIPTTRLAAADTAD
jgi:sn-glycerol 3-phosphate transport system ATP-binding protein